MSLMAVQGGWVNPISMAHFTKEKLPADNWYKDSYDLYGWTNELTYPNTMGFDRHFQMYRDIVAWIRLHVKDPTHNVMWTKIGDCIYVRFRNEQDRNWFVLRFGA
jgi:hypothetical protein